MTTSIKKAKEIIDLILQEQSIDSIKSTMAFTEDEWYRFSNKAYSLALADTKKERKLRQSKFNVSTTSDAEISSLLSLNETLANFALAISIFSTSNELEAIHKLVILLPQSETKIISIIERMTFNPRLRALQKKGRMEKLDHFKIFSKIIDAASISYYRENYISCYLTLLPVIEGIIIRWMGYTHESDKPEFEDIRKFFKNPAVRQPFPMNIQFHYVFSKVCDKILNIHFYRPTTAGTAYSNFNRHVASHLLNDNHFATKENCLRLFVLLDIMTEIFVYESRKNDPRFTLSTADIVEDIEQYNLLINGSHKMTPENRLLNL